MQQAEDFRAESRALLELVTGAAGRLHETTQFKDWRLTDVIQHLHVWNHMAFLQLEDEARLTAHLSSMRTSGQGMRAFENALLGGLDGTALLSAWEAQFEATADRFAGADPKARLKWAGPDMSARSSITARLMETWAHGQEIYDHLGVRRRNEDRIGNIVVLGVNTFAWTFATRGEAAPGPMPFLSLTAPSGQIWTYGEDNPDERIEGMAEEFCQVVTQTRNVVDTGLRVTGPVATEWMAKAQCFAGPPADPPAPGTRFMKPPVR